MRKSHWCTIYSNASPKNIFFWISKILTVHVFIFCIDLCLGVGNSDRGFVWRGQETQQSACIGHRMGKGGLMNCRSSNQSCALYIWARFVCDFLPWSHEILHHVHIVQSVRLVHKFSSTNTENSWTNFAHCWLHFFHCLENFKFTKKGLFCAQNVCCACNRVSIELVWF